MGGVTRLGNPYDTMPADVGLPSNGAHVYSDPGEVTSSSSTLSKLHTHSVTAHTHTHTHTHHTHARTHCSGSLYSRNKLGSTVPFFL